MFGFGKKNAEVQSEKLLEKKIDCFVSIGFAASTNKKIKTGDICIPKNIICSNGKKKKTSNKIRLLLKKRLNTKSFDEDLFCSEKIVYQKYEKQILYEKFRVGLIDMESEGVQLTADKHGIPFVAIKVILDNSETSIPKELVNLYINEKNFLDLIKIPILFPKILKLGIDYFKAKNSLLKVCKSIFM